MKKFDTLAESILNEKVIKTKWDKEYQALSKRMGKLPWDTKPRRGKQSAITGISGTINGKQVGFDWHSPSTDWGPEWAVIGLTPVDGEYQHSETGSAIGDAVRVAMENDPTYKNRPIDWLRFAEAGFPGVDEKLWKDNIKEVDDVLKGWGV